MGLPIGDNDVKHLIQDLRLQSASYNPDAFLERGIFRFERGYNSAPAAHPQSHRSPNAAGAAPRVPTAAPRKPAVAPSLPAAARRRAPAAAVSTIGKNPSLQRSARRSRLDSAGETVGFEVFWAVVMDLEKTLEW